MAKIAFSKLGLKPKNETKIIKINDIDIEVKTYLPVEDRLELISEVINDSADDNSFSNPVKNEAFTALEIIYKMTNISFTDKQKEDPAKIYDVLRENGVIDAVKEAIGEDYWNDIVEDVWYCADNIYSYINSIKGIITNLSNQASEDGNQLDKIGKAIQDPETLKLLKDVLAKLD